MSKRWMKVAKRVASSKVLHRCVTVMLKKLKNSRVELVKYEYS